LVVPIAVSIYLASTELGFGINKSGLASTGSYQSAVSSSASLSNLLHKALKDLIAASLHSNLISDPE